MEKKISFSFNKTQKTNILPNKLVRKDDVNKIELIKGLEGQSIQLVKEKVEEAPLVIPLKDSRKTSAALLSLKTRQAVLNGEEVPIQKEQELPIIQTNNEEPKGADNIEKRAAQELLAEVSKNQNIDGTESKLVLPVKSEDLPLDGASESTIDDYESIPISQFGFAMLRGMGWKDAQKKTVSSIDDGVILRPKGMGLGADKALKPKALLVAPEANEVLEIKKGAFIRVLGGKHKDLYGQIEGLDDHAGRVIVKMALGGTKESFNEFMVQVVCKKEYAQYSKCINSAKYDEYKRRENAQGQIIVKKEESIKKENLLENERERNYKESSHDRRHDRSRTSPQRNGSELHSRSEKSVRRSRSRDKRSDYKSSSTSNRKHTDRASPSRDRHKSNDSASSDSSSHRNKHKKSSKKKKSKKSKDKSYDRRPSASSSDEDRRYKKKTKKSKRGRSRSKCRR